MGEFRPRWYDRLFVPPLRLANRWVMFWARVIEHGLARERKSW